MSKVRWQRDCLPRKRRGFVVPPRLTMVVGQARSDVIARTRNEEEARLTGRAGNLLAS